MSYATRDQLDQAMTRHKRSARMQDVGRHMAGLLAAFGGLGKGQLKVSLEWTFADDSGCLDAAPLVVVDLPGTTTSGINLDDNADMQ